jgi:ATP-dependent Clp protease ATP-binding subunit ClpA
MFNTRFSPQARGVVVAAERVARERGARTVEAEHLLLALAELGEPELAGMDVAGMLDREFEHSLNAAGVDVPIPPARPAPRKPGFGASAKRALERGVMASVEHGDRQTARTHLLLGVLAAEEGTVPRALAIAGVDRDSLASRVRTRL